MDLNSTPISEIQSLIMSQMLSIEPDSYNELKFRFAPNIITDATISLFKDILTYKEETTAFLDSLKKEHAILSSGEISLSDSYDSTDLPDGTIAFHRMIGAIQSDGYWGFSTVRFERDLIKADANPAIAAHYVFCKSPGGEAYYLDQVSKTIRSLQKPVYVFIRQQCCSAAYYMCCHGTVVKANTQNDTIGSIGTMVSFRDWDSYYEKQGLRTVEYKATNSKLKNKTWDDLVAGKPKKFIDDVMDPINIQFMEAVKAARPIIGKMDYEQPVLQGEIYRAELAMGSDCGLIDGIITFEESLQEANQLGQNFTKDSRTRQGITKLL